MKPKQPRSSIRVPGLSGFVFSNGAVSWAWLLLALPALAAPPTIPMPQSAGILCARVNVNEAFVSYPESLGPEVLITDLSYQGQKSSTIPNFAVARTGLQRQCPSALIGTYISSRAVGANESEKREPRSVLPPELFDDSELLPPEFVQDNPPRRIVDYRQPVARKKLVRYLADEFQRSEVKLAYTDNWSHNASWENFPPTWKDTATYMHELTDELHARDIAHICNVAISVGAAAIPQADIDILAASTDGVTLEMAAHPNCVAEEGGISRILDTYKLLAKHNCRAVLIPSPGDSETDAKFLAGIAMLGGSEQYVAWPFWKPVPEWYWWPAKFGKPVGETQVSGSVASRKFANGTVAVDFANRSVDCSQSLP